MQTPPPIFFFNDLVVGQFVAGDYPARDGDIRYQPFRDPGHGQLQAAPKAVGGADCYFKRDGQRVAFRVVDCPRHGVFAITGLPDESHDAEPCTAANSRVAFRFTLMESLNTILRVILIDRRSLSLGHSLEN